MLLFACNNLAIFTIVSIFFNFFLGNSSVNDQFVMNAWAGACNDSDKKITYVADWDGSFTKAVGMDTDLSAANLGVRSKRYIF